MEFEILNLVSFGVNFISFSFHWKDLWEITWTLFFYKSTISTEELKHFLMLKWVIVK